MVIKFLEIYYEFWKIQNCNLSYKYFYFLMLLAFRFTAPLEFGKLQECKN